MMTIEEDRKICEAAMDGKYEEWRYDNGWVWVDSNDCLCPFYEPNAQFIAHFNPSKVGEMLDEIEQLRKELKR